METINLTDNRVTLSNDEEIAETFSVAIASFPIHRFNISQKQNKKQYNFIIS